MKCRPRDIHRTLSVSAASLAAGGLAFAPNAFTVVAFWCLFMHALHRTLLVYEIAGCMIAGFVFQSPLGTIGMCFYSAAYVLFLTAIVLPTPEEELPVVVVPEGDNI